MTARTDIHRPGSPDFDPQAYTLVGVFDLGDHESGGGFGGRSEQQAFSDALAALNARGIKPGSHTWGCGHCGQTNLRYVALLVREDVQEWIFAGQDCLVGRFQSQTKESFAALRKAAELARQKQAKKTAFLALCEKSQGLVFATYSDNISIALRREARELGLNRPGHADDDHLFASGLNWGLNVQWDIARKVRQYGEASDKQLALLDRVAGEQEAKWAAYVEREAAKQAVKATVVPLTEGRQLIEGTIISFKEQSNYCGPGTTLKVLVQLDGGARVFGTLPASLYEAQKGDRVRFTAAVQVKEADFGFFSRPTKAEVVATAEVAA